MDVLVWQSFSAFLGALHSPSGLVDLGHHGASHFEHLILSEQWMGHRLLGVKRLLGSGRGGNLFLRLGVG